MTNNCDTCRYYSTDGVCKYDTTCDKKHEAGLPSHWVPATSAQILERTIAKNAPRKGVLQGDMNTGYTYVDMSVCNRNKSLYNPEPTANTVEYNKMFKAKETKSMNKPNYRRNYALNRIKKVIFNEPYTIVLWCDGSKTMVKCTDEKYDPEKGLAMAISKYFFNNEGYYYDVFKKFLPKEPLLIEETSSTNSDEFISVKEYAAKNKIAESTVRSRISNGMIPGATKLNGKWKIPVSLD